MMGVRCRKSIHYFGASLVGILAACASLSAQEQVEDAAAREKWQKTYQAIAQSVVMRHSESRLTMLDQPLLFYTNPVRTNDQHGAIFLWTEAGRPAVIGSIWSAMNRQNPDSRFVTHEWHSLVVGSNVTATRGEKRLWTPGEPGIAWETLAGTPVPASQRAARLLQMRSLARRFSVAIQVEGESDLRLMAQPLYRYPETVVGVLDGAIFSFAMTTDPELLVLLEDREISGHPNWQVAFARFGNKAMTVKDDDKIVWSCEAGAPGISNGRYYLRWRAEEMPARPQPLTTNP
jgi:hypothetical protein